MSGISPGARDFNAGWASHNQGLSREETVSRLGSGAGLGWDFGNDRKFRREVKQNKNVKVSSGQQKSGPKKPVTQRIADSVDRAADVATGIVLTGVATVTIANGFLYLNDQRLRDKPALISTNPQAVVDETHVVYADENGHCAVPHLIVADGKKVQFASNVPMTLTYHEARRSPVPDTVIKINSQSATHINVEFNVRSNDSESLKKRRELTCTFDSNAPASSYRRGQVLSLGRD